MTMVSLGAAGLESGQAHASEMTHGQQNQSCQYINIRNYNTINLSSEYNVASALIIH